MKTVSQNIHNQYFFYGHDRFSLLEESDYLMVVNSCGFINAIFQKFADLVPSICSDPNGADLLQKPGQCRPAARS